MGAHAEQTSLRYSKRLSSIRSLVAACSRADPEARPRGGGHPARLASAGSSRLYRLRGAQPQQVNRVYELADCSRRAHSRCLVTVLHRRGGCRSDPTITTIENEFPFLAYVGGGGRTSRGSCCVASLSFFYPVSNSQTRGRICADLPPAPPTCNGGTGVTPDIGRTENLVAPHAASATSPPVSDDGRLAPCGSSRTGRHSPARRPKCKPQTAAAATLSRR